MLGKLSSNIILASSSPQRAALLHQIGILPDKVIPADIDETPLRSEAPNKLAARLSISKAKFVAQKNQDSFILAADTVVACGRRVLSKTRSVKEARIFLDMLSGRRHKVYGGITVICPSGKTYTRVVATKVIFKNLSNEEVEQYLLSGEWENKSGAYAIQGSAAKFVRAINGSYSNVVGLPLFETYQILSGVGFKQ